MDCVNENHRQGVIICKKCNKVYGCVDNLKISFCCQCTHTSICKDKLYKHGVCSTCNEIKLSIRRDYVTKK